MHNIFIIAQTKNIKKYIHTIDDIVELHLTHVQFIDNYYNDKDLGIGWLYSSEYDDNFNLSIPRLFNLHWYIEYRHDNLKSVNRLEMVSLRENGYMKMQ